MATLKYSRQREMIKDFLMTRKDHPTADIVYMNMRKQNPNISLGTVYRNLTLLADIGEISRLRVGDGVDHFDADTSPHYHFVCNECGNVTDLEMDSIESILETARANFDGHIAGHATYFYGTCGNCINKQVSLPGQGNDDSISASPEGGCTVPDTAADLKGSYNMLQKQS